ncbi:hypothetical protein HMSSN036_49780 [Paenibacillus macerans]|nr:hypothetical protein HMSSN036_49780 [Paenibacillus macerans]
MESIETGLKLFVLIIVISLLFALVGFLVKKYLSDFFDKIIVKIFSSIKKKFSEKRTDLIVGVSDGIRFGNITTRYYRKDGNECYPSEDSIKGT